MLRFQLVYTLNFNHTMNHKHNGENYLHIINKSITSNTLSTEKTEVECPERNNNQYFQWMRNLWTRWTERSIHSLELKLSWVLPVFLDYFWLLKDELPFLVLLCLLIGSFILPTKHLTAIEAVNIGNGVETSHELPVLFASNHNVHRVGEQKCSTIFPLWHM